MSTPSIALVAYISICGDIISSISNISNINSKEKTHIDTHAHTHTQTHTHTHTYIHTCRLLPEPIQQRSRLHLVDQHSVPVCQEEQFASLVRQRGERECELPETCNLR
jgi:hypothetical protein